MSQYEEYANNALNNLAQMQLPAALHMAMNCFNGGELTPELGSRFDQQRNQAGCRLLRNMCPMPWGGATKRPGMRFLAWSGARDRQKTARLIPFVFSASQSRMLEIYETENGTCAMRVWKPDGTIVEGASLALPFSGKVAREMTCAQSADVIFIAHRELMPGKIMRYGDTDWRYAAINWMPSIQPPQWENVWGAGTWPDNESRRVSHEYVCTAISSETGEESAPSKSWTISGQAPLSESWYVCLKAVKRADMSEIRFYKKSAGVFGYIGSVTFGDETDENKSGGESGDGDAEAKDPLVFEDHNIAPDTEDTPPLAKDPFSGAGNAPGVVFLHQQRLGFAASANRPLTVWLSPVNNFESMAASVPPEDDDAIEATLAAAQANRILWAVPDRGGVLVGTEGGEWMLQPSEGASLTPRDLSFQPQSFYGSEEGLEPARAGGAVIFAQRGGHVARALGYSFQDDRYNAPDLSILARHLLTPRKIISWAWQQEPYGILWCAMSDGKIAALTWLAEHDVMAWHRHDTDGQVENVAVIPDGNGLSRLFLTVFRNGRRAVEMLGDFDTAPRLDGPDNSPFEARLIPCLPEVSAENGSTFLAIRKICSIKAHVLNSKPFHARITSQNAASSRILPVPARSTGSGLTQEAVWNCPTASGFRENQKLELVLDGPDPATITGLAIALELADANGGAK